VVITTYLCKGDHWIHSGSLGFTAVSTGNALHNTWNPVTRTLAQVEPFKPSGALQLCGDNQGAIFNASDPVQEKQTKHIDIRFQYIRKKVSDGEVTLHFVTTDQNPADMFTKNLARDNFLRCRSHLGITFKK
jgi:hypothetical protein